MIKQLIPDPPPKIKTPPCDGETKGENYRVGSYKRGPKQCVQSSKYEIDGLHYCKRHAQEYVFKLMLEGELVRKGYTE